VCQIRFRQNFSGSSRGSSHNSPYMLQVFFGLTLASLLALLTPLTFRWLIDSILPGHQCSFAHDRDRTDLRELRREGSPQLAWRLLYLSGTQRTALSLRISLLEHIDSLSRIISTAPRSENCCIRSRANRRNLVLRLRPLPSILRTVISAGLTLSAMAFLDAPLTLVVVRSFRHSGRPPPVQTRGSDGRPIWSRPREADSAVFFRSISLP